MRFDRVSSKRSGSSDDDDVLLVKLLPWRSEQLNAIMSELDLKAAITQSKRGRRQQKKNDDVSSRKAPTDLSRTLVRAARQDTELDHLKGCVVFSDIYR